MSQAPSYPPPLPLADRREVADYNQHWLQQLEWVLLLVDGEIARYRVRSPEALREWLVVRPAATATENVFRRMQHEYAMAEHLDPAWAVVPVALLAAADGPLLILDESGGRPLNESIRETLSIAVFLRLAIGATQALGRAHRSGLLHHDIKPCNFIEGEDGVVRLTAFALSSHADRPEHQVLDAISGSLAYMSPEQAGRVSHQVDPRSDLYALGVTFYELLTHRLPFEGDDPVEWLHQHLARQPAPPEQHRQDLPQPLSAVILKLLAKSPDERYACAQDLEDDLRLCLVQWNEFQYIRAFEPGKGSRAGSRLFAPGLIAREAQLAELHGCIARVSSGSGEIALICGQTGTGKSALVRQLHRDLGGSRVMFATGKFEQSRNTTPYAALSLALRALLLRVLGESPRVLDMWRQRLLRGLADNGRLLLPLVPELELLTGPLQAIPQISKHDAASRFNDALREYILAFARPQAPLVIFFDDLQWLDDDTLGFFSYMAAQHPHHVLFIGAYREWTGEHSDAFRRLLADLRRQATPLRELTLACLEPAATGKMLAGLLGWHDPSLASLSEVVQLKSGGNPFFINQLIRTLLEEGLISATGSGAGWHWDLEAIRRFPVAANVVELMVARIGRLPEQTRYLLGLMALLGSRADFADIASVSEQRIGNVRRQLVAALEAGLLIEDKAGLLFSHDRVREAAYLLIPATQRAIEHTRIARLLIRGITQQEPQGLLFRIALHIHQAAYDDLSESDTSEFISVLLKAAHRARDAATLPFALQYLRLARSLGSEARWLSHYTQSHGVELLYAQCLVRRGEYPLADDCIGELLERTRTLAEIAALYQLKVESLSLSGQYVAAVQAALLGLGLFDIRLSTTPGAFDARQAFERIEQRMDGRSIASLLDLPVLEDPRIDAIMGLLAGMIMPVSFTDAELFFQVLCRMVEITLEHGRCPASSLGLAWFGVTLAERLGLYDQGIRYAELAGRMVNCLGYRSYEAAVLMALGQVSVWIRPLAFSLECAQKALQFTQAEGMTALTCYLSHQRVSDLLAMGTPLAQVQQYLADGLAQAGLLDSGDCQHILNNQALFAQALSGSAEDVLASAQGLRLREQIMAGEMVPAQFWWWFFQGVAAFYAERHTDCLAALEQASALAWSTPAHIHLLELQMYRALNLAALHDSHDTAATLAQIEPHMTQLRVWAQLNPLSFLDKLLLVEAEVARIQGQPLIAMRLFESAIAQATTGGFLHIKALAHELAGKCHEQLGLSTSARSHRRTAREDYQRWGALGKVRSLEAEHLYLRDQPATSRSSIDLREGQQYLDLVSVIKASQALSREIVLDRLIELLVANTLVHAGASRGLLILIDRGVPMVVATGQAGESGVSVELAGSTLDEAQLPLSIIYTVIRTRSSVALDQVVGDERFGADTFFNSAPGGAVLCLPLLKQGEVTGVLYLENSLACGIFTQSRIAVIELLAAQAAISLETSRLYAQVLEENQRRRDSETELRNIQALLAIGQKLIHSGAFRWDTTTDQMFWSDEMFAIWGIDKSDNPPSSPALLERVHPDDRGRLKSRLERARRTRQAYRHGFRAVMPDQSIKYLETLAEPAEGGVFVGVTSDVTDRKLTETALSNARRELAQVSHSTIMGELAASIAHEINQPLASIVSNASASVRWLRREVPEVQEALEGLNDIAKDGKRAADIVHALQSLAKQKVSSRSPLLIDDVIGRVLLLTAGEIEQKLVAVDTRLETSPVQVYADGVQMQQVIYNLVMNAVDAMLSVDPPHRLLTLTSSVQAGQQVVVTVEDTGPGISPRNAEEIFNAFFTTKTTGMGMGLAICRSIMSAQEGTLHMFQGRAGQTIFVFTLSAIGHGA